MLHPARNNSLALREMPTPRDLEAEPLNKVGSQPRTIAAFVLIK
jgi:hypothetical protein